nr:hypothetical protein BAR15_180260 [Bartonella sp. AR 15-3]
MHKFASFNHRMMQKGVFMSMKFVFVENDLKKGCLDGFSFRAL